MYRRSLLGLALISSALSTRLLYAQDWATVLGQAVLNEKNNTAFLGREPLPPNDPRWDDAKALLDATPTTGTAYRVAQVLESTVPDTFKKEWPPGYANPLIVDLFFATGTKPQGDVTPWCAAFVSWCIERVGSKSARSAASKEYREYGTPVWEKGKGEFPGQAREGDIAVFKSLSKPNNGHVTFYVGEDPTSNRRIKVLGGNQSDQIGYSSYRISGGDLQLISIRRLT
ncbi:CHAP domain-containing protein [Rhizobium leguminosarum]|jgi:uncharacterized protein (TIGR02594 family)|uniref:CHAP domain-containing protein n=1 Tax=Rhizobium leguminosarum TaxID=384 RepID=UPI0035115F4D